MREDLVTDPATGGYVNAAVLRGLVERTVVPDAKERIVAKLRIEEICRESLKSAVEMRDARHSDALLGLVFVYYRTKETLPEWDAFFQNSATGTILS